MAGLLTGGWIVVYGTEPVHGRSIYQWSCLRDPVFIWPGITAASVLYPIVPAYAAPLYSMRRKNLVIPVL